MRISGCGPAGADAGDLRRLLILQRFRPLGSPMPTCAEPGRGGGLRRLVRRGGAVAAARSACRYRAILPQQAAFTIVGDYVAGDFLAPAEITPRLQRLDLAQWIAGWLKEEGNVEIVIEGGSALLPWRWSWRATAGVPQQVRPRPDPRRRRFPSRAGPMAGRVLERW